MNLNANESNIIPKFNYRDLLIFLVPILIFMLYLFVYNPGVLTASSYGQLHQIATGKFTTANPIFHTLIEMLLIKLFGTPLYIGLVQILIFSVMWTVICKYHRDDSDKSNNGFVVEFIITLIICLIPINAVYSVSLSSYVLFSYFMMFLCFLIKVMLDKNGQVGTKLIVLMALTLGIMSGLSNYGVVIAIPILIVIAYYLLKNGASENTLVTFVGLAVLCIFLIASLNFVFDVQGDKLNIPADDPLGSDINLKDAQNKFFSTANTEPSESYEKVTSANTKQGSFNIIDSYVDTWRGNAILGILFGNGMLYLILSVLLLAYIYVKTELNEIFLVYLAPFINTVIVMLTGQSTIYPNILVFYLIAIICVGIYFNPHRKAAGVSDKSKVLTSPKTQTQPEFYVEETYDDDEYYSDLEAEIEGLTLEDINKMLDETPKAETTAPQEKDVKEEPKKDKKAPKKDKPKETSKKDKKAPKKEKKASKKDKTKEKPKKEKKASKKDKTKEKPKKEKKTPKKDKPKETPIEEAPKEEQIIPQGDHDLIDEILIEMGKK